MAATESTQPTITARQAAQAAFDAFLTLEPGDPAYRARLEQLTVIAAVAQTEALYLIADILQKTSRPIGPGRSFWATDVQNR